MNAFLLDTTVLCELIKPKPEPNVTTWIDAIQEERLLLSVLTLGEIRKGIKLLPRSARRTNLETWLRTELPARFFHRILEIDQEVADRWGVLSGSAIAKGKPVTEVDGLLAATALHHNLTLATRNTRDFAATGVSLFNPWNA